MKNEREVCGMTPKEMAILAAKALDSKKGGEVKIKIGRAHV